MSTATVADIRSPSRRRLAIASALAFLMAALLLVAVVLPAEYGRDPLGIGRVLGLLDLYEGRMETAVPPPPPPTAAPPAYRVDASELTLGPGQAFEYKYRLAQGASMVYAWRTPAVVKFEFHGEPDDHTQKVVSYDKREADHASGALTAAFTGIHGWYWENPTDQALTISIHSAGFFTEADEMRSKFDPVKHKDRIEYTPHELVDPLRRR